MSNFQLFHIRATSSRNRGKHPIGTIALFGSGDNAFATACVTSPKDNFSKAVSRRILVGRSNSGKHVVALTPSSTMSSVLNELNLMTPLVKKLEASDVRLLDQETSFQRQKERILFPKPE